MLSAMSMALLVYLASSVSLVSSVPKRPPPSGICSISLPATTVLSTKSRQESSKHVPSPTNSLLSSLPTQSGCSFVDNSPKPPKCSDDTKFGIYTDASVIINGVPSIPPLEDLKGYDFLYLAFLLPDKTGGVRPADQSAVWSGMNSSYRKQEKQRYNDAGISIMVSAFGATEQPTTAGYKADEVARDMAKWILANDVDGIDIDYEDFAAINRQDCEAEQWLISFTFGLRQLLPQRYLISHAPVAPWFNPEFSKSGAYVTVDAHVGNIINHYNVQFYNQDDYTDCETLLHTSKQNKFSAHSSIGEIVNSGIDPPKLVIGKPLYSKVANNGWDDASNGWMDMNTLRHCVEQAKKDFEGFPGLFFWQYHPFGSKVTASSNASHNTLLSAAEAVKIVRGTAYPIC